MEPTPPLLVLGTLLDLFEQRLDSGAPVSRSDLLLAGRQLHRLHGLYVRLIELTVESES